MSYNRQMEIKWQPIVKTKASLLFQWYVFEGHKHEHFRSALGINTGLLNQKIVLDEIFIDLNEWAVFENYFVGVIKTKGGFSRKFVRLCYKYITQLLKVSQEVGRSKDAVDNLYSKYQQAVLNLMPFMNGILALGDVLNKKINEDLENILGIKDKNQRDILLSALVVPKKKSYFVQETESILNIAMKAKKKALVELGGDIRKHLKRFEWMGTIAYLGELQTEKDVFTKVEELLNEDLIGRINQLCSVRRETNRKYLEAYKKIQNFPEIVETIDVLRELIYLQTYRLDVFFLAHYYALPLFHRIADENGIEVREIVHCTGDEISAMLKGKARPSRSEISQRLESYALIEESGVFRVYSGSEVVKVRSSVTDEISVKGTVASRGRATGKAKLLLSVDDIKKVNKGDIIVAPMTHPQLVPAIAKSAGIITDFGGLLCHAAIISREFGIPCIVGTVKATAIFKDGDKVELNAYDGTARRL